MKTYASLFTGAELADMWDALAVRFGEAGYRGLAAGCAKQAMRLRGER